MKAFYLDETEITNHHYVDFLNQNLSTISVDEGVVKADGHTWMLLGVVTENYEPIVFRNGRFTLPDLTRASYPVVRVSAYGAEAYARFYGKRLPTEMELLHARGTGEKISQRSPVGSQSPAEGEVPGPTSDMSSHMMEMMGSHEQPPQVKPLAVLHGLASVTLFPPNKYGVSGLITNIREWAVGKPGTLAKNGQSPKYVIVGGRKLEKGETDQTFTGTQKLPWEVMDDVGFRCAVSTIN